jgi:multiple sugar transport system substrate-binding protein
MFAEAGITETPKTLDDLIAAAKKLNKGRVKGLFVGNDGGLSGNIGRYLLWSAGSDDIKDAKIAFDNERTDAAFAKYSELFNSGALLVGAPTDWTNPAALIDGLVAMQYCGLWAVPQMLEALGDDVGVFLWPAFDDQGAPAISLGGWTAMVNAKSPYVEEAKAYVKWLWIENKDVQTDWAVGYGFHIPPRGSVAAEAEQLKSGIAKVFVDGVAQYGHAKEPYWTGAMDTFLLTAMTNIVKNGADPRKEVSEAAQKCQAELDASLQ